MVFSPSLGLIKALINVQCFWVGLCGFVFWVCKDCIFSEVSQVLLNTHDALTWYILIQNMEPIIYYAGEVSEPNFCAHLHNYRWAQCFELVTQL